MVGSSLIRAVVASLLLLTCGSAGAETVKKILIVGDKPDGHPATTHEFIAGTKVLAELLKGQEGLEVSVVDGREPWADGPELIRQADGIVIFVSEGGKWAMRESRRYEALTQLAARGGGISALHWGIGAKDAKYIDGYQKLIGGIHGGPDRKYVVQVQKATPADGHPITRGVEPFQIKDEFYYQLKLAKDGKLTPILLAEIDGKPETVAWAWERPMGGRSFGFSGLHFHENWQRQEYRRLVAQGVLWTMQIDVPAKGLDVSVATDAKQATPKE
jgi:type 1 glutamine amidotransferase